MRVRLDQLKRLTTQAILNYGYTEREAEMIREVLLYAQLRGNNQGIVKLIGAGIPKAADAGEVSINKETKLSAMVDANHCHPMVAVPFAVDTAVRKAAAHGMAVVGVNGIGASSGALGYYARRIAEQNLIGLVFASSPETVAADGSYQPIFGTNPLAIGVPGTESPLVLDMATAAMAYYGVIEADTAGKRLSEDIAYDKNGNPTTDPAKVMDNGALRTFDKGYKGSHLSMMVQILAGPLVGAAFMGEGDIAGNWGGHLIIAIDPGVLGGTEHLRKSVTTIAAKVKATKKLSDVEEILLPSERGDHVMKKALESGEIDIEDNLFTKLKEVAEG